MVSMIISELWLTHTLNKTFFLMTTPSRKHLTLHRLIYLLFVYNSPHITKTGKDPYQMTMLIHPAILEFTFQEYPFPICTAADAADKRSFSPQSR